MHEFEQLMSMDEEFKMPQAATDLKDLRAPIFDTKRDQYVYKSGKKVFVNYFDKQKASHNQPDEPLLELDGVTGKTVWSPQGTFLIVIRTEQVDFLGGESMIPIITLPQSQVSSVSMSPCENYVMTYSATGENAFTVWNFKMLEIIRTLPYAEDEDENSYKWSDNGKFIAKKFRTEIKKEEEKSSKVKEGISVYSLPSMEMIARADGQKKSITIEGIKDWMWIPGKDAIAYSCFYGTEQLNDEDEDYEEKKSQLKPPRIGFISIPSRIMLQTFTFNDSLELRFFMHPKGKYLGVVNQ
jgi:translation initiation factor 3 subunit B